MERSSYTRESSGSARHEPPPGLRDERRLAFPDWSQAGHTAVPLSAEQMLRLSLEYVRHAAMKPGFEDFRFRRKVDVEFVL